MVESGNEVDFNFSQGFCANAKNIEPEAKKTRARVTTDTSTCRSYHNVAMGVSSPRVQAPELERVPPSVTMERTRRPISIVSRLLFDMVDNEDGFDALVRLQFQPELSLNGGEK
jgi:hypothetical protein